MPFVLFCTAHPALEVPFASEWPRFRACVAGGGGEASWLDWDIKDRGNSTNVVETISGSPIRYRIVSQMTSARFEPTDLMAKPRL